MHFAEPMYDNELVDAAGRALVGDPDAQALIAAAGVDVGEVVNNWRTSHAYPLNTFQMTLRNRTRKMSRMPS